MAIFYHGTNEQAAKAILKEGFYPYTWFADRAEEALQYGGNHLFTVEFSLFSPRHYDWQVLLGNSLSVDHIVSYKIIEPKFSQDLS